MAWRHLKRLSLQHMLLCALHSLLLVTLNALDCTCIFDILLVVVGSQFAPHLSY